MDMNVLAPAPALENPFNFTAGDVDVEIDLARIPSHTVQDLLRSAVQSYVANRISTAESVAKKKNGPFDQYDAAVKNDPLQTLVARPDGERTEVDRETVAFNALTALYEGKFTRRDGSAPKKAKERKDPVIAHVTRAVINEVFQKNVALDPSYKYPLAAKEVGTDGVAYLRAKIAERVAAGADPKVMADFLENQYLKPARIMLGLEPAAPRFKDVAGLI